MGGAIMLPLLGRSHVLMLSNFCPNCWGLCEIWHLCYAPLIIVSKHAIRRPRRVFAARQMRRITVATLRRVGGGVGPLHRRQWGMTKGCIAFGGRSLPTARFGQGVASVQRGGGPPSSRCRCVRRAVRAAPETPAPRRDDVGQGRPGLGAPFRCACGPDRTRLRVVIW